MSAPMSGQLAYEARMEAEWGTDWMVCERAWSLLNAPDQASWEDTARLIAERTQPAPGHLMVMRGTIALRDAEIEQLRARVAELEALLADAVNPTAEDYDRAAEALAAQAGAGQ